MHKRAPAVSVVLPFHNAARTLAAAVESIQRQTFTDWELLAFDDGSEDGSADIADAFASEDARIRVLRAKHGGIVAALQAACSEARGNLLMRMDADDEALPDRMARQRALFNEDEALGICGTGVTIRGASGSGRRRYENWLNRQCTHEDIVRELFVECPLPHPTFMMRREGFDAAGGYQDNAWPEDHDLLFRFWRAGWRMGKAAGPLLIWNDTPGRLSMTDPRYSEASFRALKRRHLFETYLRTGRFHQWGAGEVGKRWLREWTTRRPEAVVDVHPRKIGQRIHGCPVIAADALPPPGETFIIAMVGAPGARANIRAWLIPRGYEELRDFLFLA